MEKCFYVKSDTFSIHRLGFLILSHDIEKRGVFLRKIKDIHKINKSGTYTNVQTQKSDYGIMKCMDLGHRFSFVFFFFFRFSSIDVSRKLP